MALLFKPNGLLDIATAGTDLPSQSTSPGSVYSEALTRCKNLRIDRKGLLQTRDGSSKLNTSALFSASELITNGTFDSSITGWTDSSNLNGSTSWDSGALRLRITGSSGSAISEQAVSISSPSVEHSLTFDITAFTFAFVFGTFLCRVGKTSGGSELGSLSLGGTGSANFTFTPDVSTVYIRFEITVSGSLLGSCYIDNVSLGTSTTSPVNLIVEQAGSRYEFVGAGIYRNESVIASSLTDAQWSAIKYNQFNDTAQQIFALNGTDRKRINDVTVYEWGITAPSAAPTSAVGAGTGLTGTYSAKTTYCRKVGSVVVSESNPSSASVSRTLANQSLSVTWVASSDSQVTHVRVYRTLAGGSAYFHDQDIAIGTLTVDTTTADASLGDLLEEDHDRPPSGQYVSGPAFDGTCFIVKDNLLYFCKPKQPEYWPTDYFIEVSTPQDPGTGPVIFHNGQPYFATKNNLFLIIGQGVGTFLGVPQDAKTGSQGPFGMVSVKGKGIFHTGPDGIYLYAGEDRKVSESAFDPIFRGETVNGIPGVSEMETAWLHRGGNNLYFGYTSEGYDYPTNILVLNLDTNRTSYYTYDDGSPIQIRCITNDVTNDRILAGDTIGYVREIEDKDVTTDSGADIDWEVQSMDYTLQTRLHFPRYAKYDVDASDATSCTGEIIVDGETVQSHTISGERNVRYRHIITCNGKRCAIRISGSGPATVYAAELE